MCSTDGRVSLSVAEEDLTCPVCLEIFTEPLILPCSHRLCAKCVAELRRNECPCDRKSFSKEVMGSLPKDHLLTSIIASQQVKASAEYYCTEYSCKKDVPHISDAYFCASCGSHYLCSTCVVKGHRDPAKHNIVNLECALNAQIECLKNCIVDSKDCFPPKALVGKVLKEMSDLTEALKLVLNDWENAEKQACERNKIVSEMQSISGKPNQDPGEALELLKRGHQASEEMPQKAARKGWSSVLDNIRRLKRTWCLTGRPDQQYGGYDEASGPNADEDESVSVYNDEYEMNNSPNTIDTLSVEVDRVYFGHGVRNDGNGEREVVPQSWSFRVGGVLITRARTTETQLYQGRGMGGLGRGRRR